MVLFVFYFCSFDFGGSALIFRALPFGSGAYLVCLTTTLKALEVPVTLIGITLAPFLFLFSLRPAALRCVTADCERR